MDEDAKFVVGKADYFDQTTVHPVGLAALIVLCIAVFCVHRKNVVVVILVCASFIAVGQRIVVFSLDFNFPKLLILAGWIRVIAREEYSTFRWNRLDICVFAWLASAMYCYPVIHGSAGLIYKLGTTFDALGMYLLSRVLLCGMRTAISFIDGAAVISMVVAGVFAVEYSTAQNLFSVFGGVPEITVIREGRLRCQGAYSHPILAGCFWASLIPMLVGRIYAVRNGRRKAVLGLIASLSIIFMCCSSTPIVGLMAATASFLIVPISAHLRLLRWTIVGSLLFLQMFMEKGVWHLLAKVSFVGGSTGWHRAHLIDQALAYWHEWILVGTDTYDHWDVFANDITNQYILEAIRGGAPTLSLFLLIYILRSRILVAP